jgi:hypothetical protein
VNKNTSRLKNNTGGVFMIIGIQRGLDGLKKKLEEKGYQVYFEDEYPYAIDAFIFNKSLTLPDMDYHDSPVLTASLEKIPCQSNKGVLLICSKNKSLEEIEEILNNRVYSPLF